METEDKLSIVKILAQSLRNEDHPHESLYEQGWYLLGEGYFSEVYGHSDSPYVIKVCRSPNSDSWPFYARFCLDNVDNPVVRDFLPSIHGFYRKHDNARHYIAVLDKLYPISAGCTLQEDDVNLLTDKQLQDVIQCSLVFGKQFLSWDLRDTLYPQLRDMTGIEARSFLDNLHDRANPIYLAGEYIRDSLIDFCDLDVHAENIMQDAMGNLIITDPVSFSRNGSSVEDVEI